MLAAVVDPDKVRDTNGATLIPPEDMRDDFAVMGRFGRALSSAELAMRLVGFSRGIHCFTVTVRLDIDEIFRYFADFKLTRKNKRKGATICTYRIFAI